MPRLWHSIRQASIAIAYANRWTLRCMKAVLDSVAWVSSLFRPRSTPSESPVKGSRQTALSESLSSVPSDEEPWVRYKRDFAEVKGWFLEPAQALWHSLLKYQSSQQIKGRFLEIGVWKGKSALCSTLHANPNELCVFVDRVLLGEFKRSIREIRPARNLFISRPSNCPTVHERLSSMQRTFRWIHIDGEHTGQAVLQDLQLANLLLSRNGIIVVDDFFNSSYPQITFAVADYLRNNRRLAPFICGHNKVYLCRRSALKQYLTFVRHELQRDMKDVHDSSVTIWKTSSADDLNCFGITDRVQQFDYRGPDWNPLKIEI